MRKKKLNLRYFWNIEEQSQNSQHSVSYNVYWNVLYSHTIIEIVCIYQWNNINLREYELIVIWLWINFSSVYLGRRHAIFIYYFSLVFHHYMTLFFGGWREKRHITSGCNDVTNCIFPLSEVGKGSCRNASRVVAQS